MNKATIKIFALAFLIAMATACAEKKNNSARVGRGSTSRSSGRGSVAALGSSGSVQPNGMGLSTFFTNYSNSDGTPFQLPCSVSQIALGASTNAQLSMQNGYMYSGVSNSGAQLQLDFLLSCNAQNTDGSVFNDIQINIGDGLPGFASASSSQVGNAVNVSFQDDFGVITLQGQISGQQFTGQMTYQNFWYMTNQGTMQAPGASSTIGNFSIPTCSIFHCL